MISSHGTTTGTGARLASIAVFVLSSALGLPLVTSAAETDVSVKEILPRFVLTPKYDETTDSRAKSEYEWLMLQVEYESRGGRDGWIDDITLEWSVMILKSGRNILMRKVVSYLDVADGKHFADVYIRPGLMRRYADNKKRFGKDEIRVHLLVRVNGVKSGTARYPKDSRSDSNWWEAEPPAVAIREGELMTRDQTPFAPLDYDFYEHRKLTGTP